MMKRYSALATAALAWLTGSAFAQAPAQAPSYAPPAAQLTPAGCGGCANACDDNCGGGFYGSVGVLFLKWTNDTNPAFSRFDRIVDVDNGVTLKRFTTMNNFDNGFEIAPRLEIGWSNGRGNGVRGRYFWFHSSDQINSVDAIDAPIGSGGIVNLSGLVAASPLGVQFTSVGTDLDPTAVAYENRLKLQTIDVEAFWGSKCGCLDLTWSLGVRYLQVAQEYNAFEALITIPPTEDFSPASPFNQSLRSGHNLNGVGPILGIEGRRAFSDNFKVYGLGRAGLIFCEGGQDAFYLANFNPQFEIQPIFIERHVERNRIVTTTEVEVGAEYTRELGRSSELFVRGGLVGQCYFGVGNSSRTTLGGDPNEMKNNNLTLFGFNFTVGIRY